MDKNEYDAQRATIPTASGRISCVDVGSGAAALFVHGLMLNSAVWRPLIEELHHSRRCIAPDLLGHGHTSTATKSDQDVSLSAQAEMLEHLCLALELDKVDLVANDFGGAIAQVFAVRYPERLRSLTLTNCDTHYNLGPPIDIRRIMPAAKAGTLGTAIAAMPRNPELAKHGNFPGRGFEDPANLTEELIVELIEPAFSTDEGRRHFERFVLSIKGDELARIETQLRTLQAPTLLVWGTDDPYFGLPWAYWLRDLLPGFQKLVEIPEGSLFIQLERTAEVAEAVLEHWAANPPSAPANPSVASI